MLLTAPPDRLRELTRLLHMAADYTDPNPGRDHITGQAHALRCAWLGGRVSEETAFVGLVHDLARPLNDVHHGEVIAEIVRDRVSDAAYQILRTHGEYQSAIVHGHELPDHPWRREAAQFASIEAHSFQTDCPAITLDHAVDMLGEWLG